MTIASLAQLIAAIGGATAGILGPMVTLYVSTRTSRRERDAAVNNAHNLGPVDEAQNREIAEMRAKLEELERQRILGQIANPPTPCPVEPPEPPAHGHGGGQ